MILLQWLSALLRNCVLGVEVPGSNFFQNTFFQSRYKCVYSVYQQYKYPSCATFEKNPENYVFHV